jgi:hypothetical protein
MGTGDTWGLSRDKVERTRRGKIKAPHVVVRIQVKKEKEDIYLSSILKPLIHCGLEVIAVNSMNTWYNKPSIRGRARTGYHDKFRFPVSVTKRSSFL